MAMSMSSTTLVIKSTAITGQAVAQISLGKAKGTGSSSEARK
jgi:hypothetical protein